MGSFDLHQIYAGNICTYTFFYQSVNFYLIKKKSKTPKNKNVASVLQELFFTFSCQSFGGRGDTAVYETGFFFFYLTKLFIEKSRITVFNIHT